MSQPTTISTTNVSATTNATHTHEESGVELVNYIVFIFGSVGLGAIFRIWLQKWSNRVGDWKFGSLLKIPYTVFLMCVGMVMAGLGIAFPNVIQPFVITGIDPELFFQIFLPVVIFESAYVIDTHVFWRSIKLVSLLAVPGLLMSTCLTALLSQFIPEIKNISNLTARVYISMIFGAILSATDPVAVVAILKELGCQKYMSVIIEGEALLNDGVSTVVFRICLILLQSMTRFYEVQTASSTGILILQQTFLGPIIGWLAAKLEGFILQKVYNDALAEITLTVSFTYLAFHIGEALKTSGVLAVVTLGIALDRSSITPEVDHFLHRFWEMLAYLANTLIFVIVGNIIAYFLDEYSWSELGHLVLLYLGVNVARAISIFSFYPLIRKFGLDLTWKHTVVMIWSGLRGAVGLALAVYLRSFSQALQGKAFHEGSDGNVVITTRAPSTYDKSVEDIDFDAVFLKILRHTAGIVLLTLVINASTVEAVLRKMGMLDITGAQQVTMLNAVNRAQHQINKIINVLKYDRFLADAKWKVVEEMTLIDYPYKDLPEFDAKAVGYANVAVHVVSPQDSDFLNLLEESRLRLIKALKMSFSRQYSRGLMNDQEVRVLIAAAEKAIDNRGEFINVESIQKTWDVGKTLPYIKKKLEHWYYGRRSKKLTVPEDKHRRMIFQLVTADFFEILMQFIIVLNVVPIAFDFAVDETWENETKWSDVLKIINIVFIAIYTLELVLRFTGLGFNQGIKNGWIQFDIVILISSYIEIIIEEILEASAVDGTSRTQLKYGNVTKLLRILRALRLLRLSKAILPRMINFINKKINKRLSFGYNVAKGFVTAEDEVSKLIATISENKIIQSRLMKETNDSRTNIIKQMTLLQRDQPGITISVKTRNAITTLLNNSKDAIAQLYSGGVIDDTEIKLLERAIEFKLKRLSNFPPYLSPCEPEDVVEDIVWIKENPEILQFVKKYGVWRRYDHDDIIMSESTPFEGIHIIVHGIVKSSSASDQVLRRTIKKARSQLSSKKKDSKPEEINIPDESLKREDILGTGEVIGYLPLLTEGESKCTIVCESAVQTHFLSVHDMEHAFKQFPQLHKTIWKVAAIPIATKLHIDSFDYQGIVPEIIQQCLSQGEIIEMNKENNSFNFTEGIGEAYLIYGVVTSPATSEILVAPVLLLPEQKEIQLYWTELAVLLVIQQTNRLSHIATNVAPNQKRSKIGSIMF